MKNLVHIIIVGVIALAFVYLNHIFQIMIVVDWLEGIAFKLYWGWFSWLTLIEYIIFTVFGGLAGLCMSLVVGKEKAYLWGGVTGISMILIYATTIKIAFLAETSFSQYAAIYMPSVMFFIGALIGSFALIKTKEKLTK